jgi:hypothetical protein
MYIISAEFGSGTLCLGSDSAHADPEVVYIFRNCYYKTLKKFILCGEAAFAR